MAASVTVAPPAAMAVAGPLSGEVGTVTTVAGPTFCRGRSVVDRAASTVRSVAIDAGTGIVHYDTGRTSEGLLGMVDADGRATLVTTGVPGPAPPRGARVDVSPPARLASDGQGGVFMAVGAGVVQAHLRGGAAVVTGQPGEARQGSAPNGDGGPALQARFAAVASVATDEAGNLFVAERLDRHGALRIRVVNRGDQPVTFYAGTAQERMVAPGAIDTIAGLGTGGPKSAALTARLAGYPPAMAVAADRLYVASSPGPISNATSARVQVVNLSGVPVAAHGTTIPPAAVETVAGNGRAGFGGDGGSAPAASFSYVPGIGLDATGNLYLADAGNHRVRRVDPTGVVTTFAGTGGTGANAGGFDGNDRPATQARLNRPYDVKAAPGGRIYIADQLNHQLRFVDEAGMIHAARGNGVGLTWTCRSGNTVGSPAFGLRPSGRDPATPAFAGRQLYFAAPSAGVVMRVEPSGEVSPVTPNVERQFREPSALAAAADGRLYVLDEGGLHLANLTDKPMRRHGASVRPGAVKTVLSGSPGGGFGGLSPPGAVVTAPAGDVFVADPADFAGLRVRHLHDTGRVTLLAGSGTAPASGCCGQPAALAVDAAGNLYVASALPISPAVWFVNRGAAEARVHGQVVPAGGAAIVAGGGKRGFGGDGGPAVEAQFQSPRGLAADRSGNLYVADAGDHTVRKVDTNGVITTVAGTGTAAFNGDGLKARLTALAGPAGLAMDVCGNLLVADAANSRLRQVNLVGSCAAAAPRSSRTSSRSPVGLLSAVVVIGVLAGAAGGVAAARRRAPG